jgi:aminoglycoside 6'-N-acetyltransferase I
MNVRSVQQNDRLEWLRMRRLLWADPTEDHEGEVAAFLEKAALSTTSSALLDSSAVFVIDRGNGTLGGFLEATIRTYAEGCSSDRVAYIEGWYVDADLRQQGYGRRLVEAAEVWGRSLGLTEMASDCLLDNTVSYQAHRALGFEEVDRIICFRKTLDE